MTLDEVRRFALSLPEVTEQPHFDYTSFRVGKIFATAPPGGEHLHVFVDEGETKALVAEDPEVYSELWWGKRLLGVRVRLAGADREVVCELLEDAWRGKAPKRLLKRAAESGELPGSGRGVPDLADGPLDEGGADSQRG